MSESREEDGSSWPPAGVLVACAVLLAAGYGVAVLRGPAPAREVRAVTVPAPEPMPEPAPPAE